MSNLPTKSCEGCNNNKTWSICHEKYCFKPREIFCQYCAQSTLDHTHHFHTSITFSHFYKIFDLLIEDLNKRFPTEMVQQINQLINKLKNLEELLLNFKDKLLKRDQKNEKLAKKLGKIQKKTFQETVMDDKIMNEFVNEVVDT